MRIQIILILLNVVGLAIAIVWWAKHPDYEPAITIIGLTGALATQLFFGITSKEKDSITLKQKSGDNSNNYQAKGNITINKK